MRLIPAEISSEPDQIMTIATVGQHFGVNDMTPTAYISGKGLAACTASMWIADTAMQCVTPEVAESAVERNTVQVVVDGIRSSILGAAPFFNYTDLPTFYAECTAQGTEECFDCVISSCYQVETSKVMSAGNAASDVLDLCESTAGNFCKFNILL